MKHIDKLKIVDALKQQDIDVKLHYGVITLNIIDFVPSKIDNVEYLVIKKATEFDYDPSKIIFSYSRDYLWIRFDQ